MSTEPLRVKTAAALGWKDLSLDPDSGVWSGIDPHGSLRMAVPPYDTSFCSAGPLIVRFKIGTMWDHGQWVAQHSDPEGRDAYAGGESPTEAVCRLIVILAKESRLKE